MIDQPSVGSSSGQVNTACEATLQRLASFRRSITDTTTVVRFERLLSIHAHCGGSTAALRILAFTCFSECIADEAVGRRLDPVLHHRFDRSNRLQHHNEYTAPLDAGDRMQTDEACFRRRVQILLPKAQKAS